VTYLLGIVAALVVLVLLVRFPVPTTAGLVTLGVGVGVFIAVDTMRDGDTNRRETAPISVSDLEIVDLTLQQANSSWELSGTVENNSSLTLTRLRILVEVESCGPDGACSPHGRDVVSVYESIPAGTRGEISEFVDFGDIPERDDWTWNYRVVEVRGGSTGRSVSDPLPDMFPVETDRSTGTAPGGEPE